MKIVYKPFGIVLGIAAGILSQKVFNAVWGVFDKEEPPKATTPQGMDPKVPLNETTLNQVTQTLAGKGGPPRPDPNKPAAKAPEAQALVLPYNPVRPRPGSAEVKRFLEARKPPRNGAVQLLLVLREMKG